MEQDQWLPFASEHKQGSIQPAGKDSPLHLRLHAILEVGTYQKVHTGREECKALRRRSSFTRLRTPWADLKERSPSSPAPIVASGLQVRSGSPQKEPMSTSPGAASRNWTKRYRRSGPA